MHHFEIGTGFGKQVLISSIKSTCKQIDQEEHKKYEKESVIHFLHF